MLRTLLFGKNVSRKTIVRFFGAPSHSAAHHKKEATPEQFGTHGPEDHTGDESGDHSHDHDHDHGHGHKVEWSRQVQPNKTTKTMYYSDPHGMAIKVCSIIALHDEIKTKDIQLVHTWRDLGISPLGKMEILIEMENEFQINIPDDDQERFKNVYDLVQYLSKSVFIH